MSLRFFLSFALVAVIVIGGGCATVNAPLSLPEMALGEPSFFPTLEAYASAPIVGGNTVDILLNGEQIFPAMLDAIEQARTSITYAQYFYEDGPIARDIAEALAERCRAGLGVHVLLDGFGALNMPSEYTDLMKRSGCHVATFRPLSHVVLGNANKRNHRRILVVDGRIGFTGGSGVSYKWMGDGRIPDHWRETDVRVEGPVVEYLQGAFAENWLEATGVVLGGENYFPRPLQPTGQVYAQVVRSSPAGGASAMYTTFLLAIASAQRTIYITNPYFVVDKVMETRLIAAAERGVKVVVLVPGKIDHNLVRQASRGQFGRMLLGGIEIFEYTAALLHSKTMVIDGVWTTIGSTNLDNRSFAMNEELNLVVYNAAVGRAMENVFREDLRASRQIDYKRWRARGIKERLFELLARPIRAML